MIGWRKDCKSTIRNSYQILSRGTPNLENELWNVSAQVINGALTPEAAASNCRTASTSGISRPSDGARRTLLRQREKAALASAKAG